MTAAKNLAMGWRGAVGSGVVVLVLLCVLAIVNGMNQRREIAEQRATGLGAIENGAPVAFDFIEMSHRSSLTGQALGTPEDVSYRPATLLNVGQEAAGQDEQLVVKKASMTVVAADPVAAADRIRELADSAGGYISEMRREDDGSMKRASTRVRVPAAAFDAMRDSIRRLAIRVEGEKVETSDVTKEYIDLTASIRNMRAEEAQLLAIMQRSGKMSEILEVAKHLADVRGRLEKAQGEEQYLAHKVRMSTIDVVLAREQDVKVFGLNWRPLYRLKLATMEGLQGIANYVDSMVFLALRLPAVLLWILTFVLLGAGGWRVFLRLRKRLFPPATAAPQSAAQ